MKKIYNTYPRKCFLLHSRVSVATVPKVICKEDEKINTIKMYYPLYLNEP